MAEIILILSIIFAAIFNAVMDKLQFHFRNSIFPDTDWVNPSRSWNNKYKKNKIKTYLLSTIFAWTTDLFHMAKFLWMRFLLFTVIMFKFADFKPIVNSVLNIQIDWVFYTFIYIMLWVIYSFTFELFFGIIFNKKGIKGYIEKYFKSK